MKKNTQLDLRRERLPSILDPSNDVLIYDSTQATSVKHVTDRISAKAMRFHKITFSLMNELVEILDNKE